MTDSDAPETPQPPATEPWEHVEIRRLQAKVAMLEGELEKVYEIGRTEIAVIRGKVALAFHNFGLNHYEASAKAIELVPEK